MKIWHQNCINSIPSTLHQESMFMCMCVSVYPPSPSKYLPFILSSFTGILPPNPLRISYELLCPQQSPKLLVDSGMQPLISWKSLCFIFLSMHFQTCPVTKSFCGSPWGRKRPQDFVLCVIHCCSAAATTIASRPPGKHRPLQGTRISNPFLIGIPTNSLLKLC